MRTPSGTASVASLARWRASSAGSPLAWLEVLEHTSSKRRADCFAHLQHLLGDVELVLVQGAGQAFEVAHHLQAGHAQAAGAHQAHRLIQAARMSPPGPWPTT